MKNLLLLSGLLFSTFLAAQSHVEIYTDELAKHRLLYKSEFINHPRSPLTAADTGFIDFFPPDHSWDLQAKISLTPDAQPFDLPTFNGQAKKYRQYGILEMEHKGTLFFLSVYQSINLMKDSAFVNYLFMPFTDLSNGETTYEGGRYIDFSIGDIKHNTLRVDFNKCYNPYCAFSDGYSCPVPPLENRLKIEIPAGEKKFRKERKH
jgi:uncharacterized protein (DUF1684 family)